MRVEIKNYQAIQKATLEFDKGITAIVGSTNSGKSSIIRAIKGAINNQSGNGFINYEADESSVKIITPSNIIEWTKGRKGSGKYIINGEEITKIGRTQNQEVADLLNMEEIEVGNTKVRINFWDQMEKAFLMDNTPGQLFNFIAQSKEQEQVTTLEQTKKTELQTLSNEIKTNNTIVDMLQTDLIKLKETNETLKPFNDFDMDLLDQRVEALTKTKGLLSTLDTISEDKVNLTNTLTKINKPIKELETILSKIAESDTKLKPLQKAYQDYLSAFDEGALTQLKLADNFTEIENLEKAIKALDTKYEVINSLEKKLNNIKGLRSKVVAEASIIEDTKGRLDKITQEVTELEIELNSFEVCPFCGNALNKEGGCVNE